MRVSLLSLGCKVNQAETAEMEGLLGGNGFEVVPLVENPELCIINTCTVTSKSDYQSRQLIRRARRAGARVLVTGCYATLNPEKVAGMEGVEGVIRNADKSHIIKDLANITPSYALNYGGGRTRLFLKVQDGCSRACSYCVIPQVRGRPRSIEPREVMGRIRGAVSEGYKEVVLSGIHLGLYGRDLSPGVTLSGLVEEILGRTSIERLRLSSLEITEVDDRMLGLLSDRRLCSHLHIPLQSGDDRVLSLMNRPYNKAFFAETLQAIRRRLGDIALGTDVIAGFPGETEPEFENTLKLLTWLPFTYIHVFPYSPRPGTRAAEMPGRVSQQDLKRRASILRGLSLKKKRAHMQRQVGRTLDTLVEERVDGTTHLGTSSNYLKVKVVSEGVSRGDVVPARVLTCEEGVLRGEALNPAETPRV
jgi:threonylcarbamoyladenosine tRNA methylthiotransferase MtaB